MGFHCFRVQGVQIFSAVFECTSGFRRFGVKVSFFVVLCSWFQGFGVQGLGEGLRV